MSEDLPLLAVPNISAVGVSETLAATSRNMVETALIKTGKFMVLSYTDMEEILEAQAFSLSGCTDESCAIEIGELLAVDNIVVGDLSAVGNGMVLSIRLVNVTTSRTESGEVVTIADVDSMQDTVFSAAYALAGMKYVGGSAVEEKGTVYVMPPEGQEIEVFIDKKSYGTAPVLVEDLAFGVHLLEAKSTDYDYRSEFSVASKEIMEITADVNLLKGNLFLTVLPPSTKDYEIELNGMPGEKGLNRDLPIGDYDIRIAGEGWYYSGEGVVEQDQTTRIVIELVKAGSLQIFGPEGIEAEIKSSDGIPFPVSDIKKPIVLPAGSYSYTILHKDYETVNGNIDIAADTAETIHPRYLYNEQARIKQRIAELEEKRAEAEGVRKVMLPIAWSFTGLGTAGLALSGGMEGAVQYGATHLEEVYADYSASTEEYEVKSLVDELNEWKENIPLFRDIRNISLLGGVISVIIGGALFLNTPSIQAIDDEIAELKGMLK